MGKIETGARGVKPRVDLRLYRGLDSPSPPFAEVVELVDALASGASGRKPVGVRVPPSALRDRKSTRLNSSHPSISYAVFCLKKKMNSYFMIGVLLRLASPLDQP